MPQTKLPTNATGQHMLKFFYNAAPNPMKIALLLEELGLSYEAIRSIPSHGFCSSCQSWC
jgi:hypothetical protein